MTIRQSFRTVSLCLALGLSVTVCPALVSGRPSIDNAAGSPIHRRPCNRHLATPAKALSAAASHPAAAPPKKDRPPVRMAESRSSRRELPRGLMMPALVPVDPAAAPDSGPVF